MKYTGLATVCAALNIFGLIVPVKYCVLPEYQTSNSGLSAVDAAVRHTEHV